MTPGGDRIPPIALAQLAGAVVLLGASWPITRYALLQGAAPSWFALGRAGLSAAVATLGLAVLGRLRLPRRRDAPALLALGLLQLAGFFALAHAAVAWVPAGRTAILSNATIIFTVPLSLLALRERIPPRRWLAGGLGAAGVLVLTGPWAIDWSAPNLVRGHAFLLGAALCWAVAMLVVRRWPPALSMLELLPWAFGLATLALLPTALAHDRGVWTSSARLAMLAIGLLIAPIGTWCIMQATTALPMVLASVGFLAGPAVGVMLAAVFLHEALGADILAGTGLILAGAGLASTKGRGG